MGNRESLHLKEGKHFLEIDEKILRDFQHCINVADRTMTGFARSLDALRASGKLPFNNGDVKLHEQSQGRQDNQTKFDSQLVADLHQTLYDCVTDNEYVHMESLSKLFSLVFSIGKDYIVFSQAQAFSFSVDKYLIQQNVGDIENGKQYDNIHIGVLQEKIEDLKYALKIAEEEVKNFKKSEEAYQKGQQTLKSTIKKLENNVRKLKSEKDVAYHKNVTFATRIAEKEDLVISLKKTLKSQQNELNAEKENKNKIKDTLTGENEGYLRTINELQTTVSVQTHTIEELREEIESLNTQNEELNEKMKNTNYEVEEFKSTVDKLQRNIDEMDTQVGELKKIRKENTELKQSLEEERESKQDVIKKMDEAQYSHSKEKEIIEKKVKSLKEENESLTANQAENKIEIEILELQIEILKNRKVMHVQAFQPFSFGAPAAKEKLFTIIKNKIELKDIELNVMRIDKPSQVDLNVPLILNCSRTTSTFKKDKTIASSLEDFPEVTKKMLAVVYHIIEEKDLKKEVELIDNEAGKDLWGIFNIGYKNKIYRCPTNTDTIDGIVDFLLEEGDVRYKASGETAL